MQIQQHFQSLIKHIYNFKILVSASDSAKATITQKGLSPALFLRPLYKQTKSNSMKIDFNLIDVEDYRKPDEKSYAQKTRTFLNSYYINTKNIQKASYQTRNDIQDHINSQNFLWFFQASKLYLQTTSFDFRVTTIDQPFGIVQILSADDQDYNKQYFKLSQTTNSILKYGYSLNPSQITKVQTMIIILIDRKKKKTIDDALKYTQILKKQYAINGNLIYRLQINNQDSEDMTIWSNFIKTSYHYKIHLKQSDVICMISNYSYEQMERIINNHKQLIFSSINKRLEYLGRQYRQFSKTANKIFGSISFFGSSNTTQKDRYTNEQQQCRQYADLCFLLNDYKRAFDAYKQIVGKFESRNKLFYVSLLEMMNHCIVLSKINQTNIKNQPYNYVEKQAKTLLYSSNEYLFIKYSIFMLYTCYVLKTFKRQFIKDYFYVRLKQKLKETINNPSIYISVLLEQQYATFHLNYPQIEYRYYGNALLKAGTHFSDAKLPNNAYRCFLVIENIYKNTFNVIEIFVYTYLAKMCLQNKHYQNSINYLRKGWNAINNKITEERYSQFNSNYAKILNGLQQQGVNTQFQKQNILLRFPNVIGFDVTTYDQTYEQTLSRVISKKQDQYFQTQSLWVKLGELYFGDDNKSKSLNAMQFKRLQCFDGRTIQQKYLAYRFKSALENEKVIQKYARVCYKNQKIKIQIIFHNLLNKQIEISKCRPILIGKDYNPGDLIIEPQHLNFKIRGNTQKIIEYYITPKKTGIYEIISINWIFNKLSNHYDFPKYQKKTQKNYYFKLNVKQQIGRLKITPKQLTQSTIFVGQIYPLKLMLVNEGKVPIDQITMIVEDPKIFGFSSKKFQYVINPSQKMVQIIKIRFYNPKPIKVRALFIYKTQQTIRMKRFCIQYTPLNLLEIKQLKCQKLSSHIHLLTFELLTFPNQQSLNKSINILQQETNKQVSIEQIVFSSGFRIIKFETTKIHNKISYTIFLQKNLNMHGQSYSFKNKIINKEDYNQFIQVDQEYRAKQWSNYQNKYFPYDHPDRMNLILVFSFDNRLGICHPQKFATNPKLLKILDKKGKIEDYLLPFDFKIHYPQQISHNFAANPILVVDIQIIIKNIFTQKPMELMVEFIDGDQLLQYTQSGYWQGETTRRLLLEKDNQSVLKINFVVSEPGIYDLSKIKYTLFKQKNKSPAVIMHNIYEKLYINIENSKQINKVVPNFNFMKKQFNDQIDLLE